MKRFVSGLIVGFLLATGLAVSASVPIKLIVNGQEIATDVPPQIINGRTMVPARFVAEPLGATVEWNESEKAVIVATLDDWVKNPANEYYFLGRHVVEVLGAKYPMAHIELKPNGELIFDENTFMLTQMISDRVPWVSIRPIIEAGLLTLDDL